MKILFISEFFYPNIKGGGELSSYLLAKYILEYSKKYKKNIKIHVLTSQNNNLKKYEETENIKIHRLLKTGEPNSLIGNIKRLEFKKSLLRNLELLNKKENFDLIHCFNITSIYSILLKNKIKKPFILHVNSPVLFCPKGTLIYQDKHECNLDCNLKNYTKCYLKSKNIGKINFNPLIKYNPITFFLLRKRYIEYKKLLSKFDYYIAISNYMKKRLINEGINENKIEIIYNIIENINQNITKKIKHKIKNKNKEKQQIKKILYLGPYTEPKGCKILFDVLKEINKEFIANFYGKGILKDYMIKHKNQKINISDEVPSNEVLQIINKHDIIIIPSIVAEAFSRTALEAISLKKIVIANNIGGITDIIIDKKSGYLYNNEKELKELICKAIDDKLKTNLKFIKKHIKKFKNQNKIFKIYQYLINKSNR
ncbi:MAG: glycosyltransferase [Candidatus Woesearchaeota archaeon]